MSTPLIETVSVDDRGFDLILGGGLRAVRRTREKRATVLLVRGSAGVGKTLVGFHAAWALAKKYPGPIAYACTELLPTELEAQIRAWRTDLPDLVVRHRDSEAAATSPGGVVVEASLLELGEDRAALGIGVERLVERLASEGRMPGVLVIDSLVDGYGIGSSAPREFVDAVCKLAAHWGIALVLLEECASNTTSPWVFAADTVIELARSTEEGASRASSERVLTVLKHRFGPSDTGPHRFTLEPGRPLEVLPRPSAWLQPRAAQPGIGRNSEDADLAVEVRPSSSNLSELWHGAVMALFGTDLAPLAAAFSLVRRSGTDPRTLLVDFSRPFGDSTATTPTREIGVASPYLSPHRFLAAVVRALGTSPAVERIILSDLRALRAFVDEEGLRHAIGVVCLLARRLKIGVVLVHSSPGRRETSIGIDNMPQTYLAPGVDLPWSVDLADISMEASPRAGTTREWLVKDHRQGRQGICDLPR